MSDPNFENADPGTKLAAIAGLAAENMIKKRGGLPPFGIGMNSNHENTVYSVDDDKLEDATPEMISDLLRKANVDVRFVATAIVATVQITPDNQKPRDAIAIQVEVPGKGALVLARTFKKGFFGYKFGELFNINEHIAPPVFTHTIHDSGPQ